MTHPLTPREKVAQIIRDGMSRLAASQAGARPVVSASKEADRVASEILTALASGSGDHAELARLAEAATPGEWRVAEDNNPFADGRHVFAKGFDGSDFVVLNLKTDHTFATATSREQQQRNALFSAAADPATVLALLAENAALRESISRHDRQVSGMLRARLSAEARATEAERKLAEAVSVMDQIREAGSISKARDLARVFISKEAERG